jgi:hypothetical protein
LHPDRTIMQHATAASVFFIFMTVLWLRLK